MLTRIHNGYVIGVAAFLVPVIGAYAPLGLAPLIMVAAVAAVVVRRAREGVWPRVQGLAEGVCLLAMVWAAASILWSIDPPMAHVSKLIRLGLLLLAGFVLIDCARALPSGERSELQKSLLAGFAAAMVLLVIDRVTEGAIRQLLPNASDKWTVTAAQFNRGMAILASVIWPVLLVVSRRSIWASIVVSAAVLALVGSFTSSAAIIAIAAGIVTCWLTLNFPRALPALVAVGVVLAIFAGPFVSQRIAPPDEFALGEMAIPNSAHHRLLIWNFTADRITDRPVLGWGFNSSKSIPGNKRNLAIGSATLPLHPHNAWLQWWLELGVIGALLGGALMAAIAWRLRRLEIDHVERAFRLAQLVAVFVIGGVAYGAWQSWWIATIMFAVAFMTGSLAPPIVPRDQR